MEKDRSFTVYESLVKFFVLANSSRRNKSSLRALRIRAVLIGLAALRSHFTIRQLARCRLLSRRLCKRDYSSSPSKVRRYARAPNIRFEILSLFLLLPFLLLLIITIAVYGAAIRNRQLAHSVADATALIASYIARSCLVQPRASPARYFTADNPRGRSTRRGGDAHAEVRTVYIPAVIANAFYAPANIAPGRSRGLDRRRCTRTSTRTPACVCIPVSAAGMYSQPPRLW